MRPIKFRVWVFESDIKKGYMLDIYENFEKDCNSDYYLVYEDFIDLEDGRGKFCIPLQFTGLQDKNGKEIYEGDILQLKRLDGSVLFYKIFCVKGGFAFNAHQDDFYKPESEIYFYESTSDMQSSSFISNLQIIGNVFENPELLENKFAD